METSLTIDDLVAALAERLEYAEGHEHLKTYFGLRAALMCEVFGCDLEKKCGELDRQARENRRTSSQLRKAGQVQESWDILYEVDGRHCLRFLNDCLKLVNASMVPGGIWLEGRPPRIQRELLERYHDVICDRERELKDLYRGMVRDLLEYLFPGIGKWQVPPEKLFEMGLPREKPDVNDHF